MYRCMPRGLLREWQIVEAGTWQSRCRTLPAGAAAMTRLTLDVAAEAGALIADTARATGRAEADVAAELLTEAAKMRRIPGVGFAEGPTGRRATLLAVGIDVFTVVGAFRSADGDWEALKQAFHWVPEYLLRAALAYASAFPDEIEARLRDEDGWTQEHIWATCPFTQPHPKSSA